MLKFMSPAAVGYILCLTALFGACMGSFLNCMAWRIVHEESVMKGRSHCDVCGHTLGFPDLIPVVSFLLSKGKCRYCGAKLSKGHLFAELTSAAVFLIVVLRFDLTLLTVRNLLFCSILLGVSFADLQGYIIPNRFHIAAIAVWLLFLPVSGGLLDGLLGGFLVGGGLLGLVLLYEKIRKIEAMGGGDLKLLFVTGLYLGWAGNLLCVFLACLIGIVCALVQMRRTGSSMIPWGPSIALSAFITLLYGNTMLAAYLTLF